MISQLRMRSTHISESVLASANRQGIFWWRPQPLPRTMVFTWIHINYDILRGNYISFNISAGLNSVPRAGCESTYLVWFLKLDWPGIQDDKSSIAHRLHFYPVVYLRRSLRCVVAWCWSAEDLVALISPKEFALLTPQTRFIPPCRGRHRSRPSALCQTCGF